MISPNQIGNCVSFNNGSKLAQVHGVSGVNNEHRAWNREDFIPFGLLSKYIPILDNFSIPKRTPLPSHKSCGPLPL